jgi:PAP2 superfamily
MVLAGLGWMPWRMALACTAVLLVVMGLLALRPRTRGAARVAGEVALILALYAVWQIVGSKSNGGVDGAADAGLWVAQVQQNLFWPSEAYLQQMVLGNSFLVAVADWYYASLHVPVFVATLVWVMVMHRRDWPFARTTVVLLTGACLLVQFKPVAPPRLLPQLGVLDTAAENGRSVYGAIAGANQYSAMPSVHIAWASAVALLVIVSARTSWRWLVIAYPIVTLWVVVVTGNHFILDGVVSVILLAFAVGVTLLFPSQRPERLARLFGPDEPVGIAAPVEVMSDEGQSR